MTENTRVLSAKLRDAVRQLPYLPRTLGLIWAATRSLTLAWAGLLVVQGLLPLATVYLTYALVNGLVAASETGVVDAPRITLCVGLLLANWLLLEILNGVASWIRTAQAELLKDHISALIQKQSVAADLAFYESPDFFDHLHRAREEANHRPIALLENVSTLLQNGITLLAMGIILISLGPWLTALLFLSTLPAFGVVLLFGAREHLWRLRTTEDERRAWYYDWLLTTGETAAEIRLFGLGAHFQELYQRLRRRLRGERLALVKSESLAEIGAGVFSLLITGAALIWMVGQVLQRSATLGDLVLFYQAFQQGQRMMRSLLRHLGQFHANILFLGNLFEFLALKPTVVDPLEPRPVPPALREGIRFEQVDFRYPGSQRPALAAFNLDIPAGQLVALVGPNGAGKSTLVKLLCRFYDPAEGRITFDNIDLRQFTVDELRSLITVLFQQPVHYNASVAENIALGDVQAAPARTEILAAAESAGADALVARLPQGYDTMLGKWFAEGAELSVGEWQRLALARGFLRRAPIIILDEPTSAMDSWAEADWLERFRSLAAGRTTLIITHRFTTARHADMIHVMVDGRIVESGSHRELLKRGGRYAQSWETQMKGLNQG